jgi:hypothetical protein
MDDLEETVRETFHAHAANAPEGVDLLVRVREQANHRRLPPWMAAGAVAAAVGIGVITATNHVSREGQPAAGTASLHVVDGPALCNDIEILTWLRVKRSNPWPQNHLTFQASASYIVSDRSAVRALAQGLCALAPLPTGVRHCPVDYGIAYRLVFSDTTKSYPAIKVDAGGCEPVTGLGPTRSGDASVWNALGAALHWPKPYATEFRGQMPS